MEPPKPFVVVTGVSGNLGLRLLPMLREFNVIGVDVRPPQTDCPLRFEQMDLGEEWSTRALFEMMRDTRPQAVIHLAFVLDPVRAGVLDSTRMWQINVAGTARVVEAITEVNRAAEHGIQQFIFPSSVSAYGPELSRPATEDSPLLAHTLTYAVNKKDADEVVQQRCTSLRGCSVYILRPHIFAGASVENYMVGAFRGTVNGKGPRAEKMRAQGKRLPCMLPRGDKYLQNRLQFVHVDDMARLLVHILHRDPESQRLSILNVAGRGEPLSFARCIELAKARLIRVPNPWFMRKVLEFLWNRGISAIPPDAAPYMMSEYLMDTARLQKFLGPEYEDIIRHTNEQAYQDYFAAEPAAASHSAGV
jgi:nucleoside-diphosphate-sugar epimerase